MPAMKYLSALALLGMTGCAHLDHSLLETDRQFSAYSISNGVSKAFAAYCADDAVSLPAGDNPIAGRKQIVESIKDLDAGKLSWTPQKEFVSRSGDLGCTWGTYQYRMVGTNEQAHVSYGKYCTVWRRKADGSWKVVLDVGNQSPPPPR